VVVASGAMVLAVLLLHPAGSGDIATFFILLSAVLLISNNLLLLYRVGM
jgi:hypothetical protein